MNPVVRWSVQASWDTSTLRVFEPTRAEVVAAAPALAAYYNDSHNASMMTNTRDLTVDDVVETFESFWAAGDRPFLLERDGELMGDADFRHIADRAAEFAIMVGQRAQQSRGLGTRYAAMLHVAAWRVLQLERVYATVIPANAASRRMLEKLGYQVDLSPRAMSFTEDEDDVALSIDLSAFELQYAELAQAVVITSRG